MLACLRLSLAQNGGHQARHRLNWPPLPSPARLPLAQGRPASISSKLSMARVPRLCRVQPLHMRLIGVVSRRAPSQQLAWGHRARRRREYCSAGA